jgi:glycosyltransferase involved in cell wall biosynthesis
VKILLVPSIYLPSTGGIELNTHALARHLLSLGHDVIVLTSNWRQWHLRCSERIDNVQVYRLPFYVFRGKLKSFFAFLVCFPISFLGTYFLIRSFSPDVINVHFIGANAFYIYAVRLLRKTPLVATFHGNEVINVPDPMLLRMTSTEVAWMKRIIDLLCRRADYILGVSQYLIAAVKKLDLNISANTCTIPFARSPRSESLASGRSPVDRPYVLAVGRFSKEKGMDLLIDAFQRVVSKIPEAFLVIIGDGSERKRIESRIVTHGLGCNVLLTGLLHQSMIHPYYEHCLLLTVPSRCEGLPTVIWEAFSYGKPVVATDVGGIPETVFDRVTGLLVDSENKTQLAEAIITLLEDIKLRTELGDNARAFLEKLGGWKAVANKYLEVYNHAIAHHLTLP